MHHVYLGCQERVGFIWFLLYIWITMDYYCRKAIPESIEITTFLLLCLNVLQAHIWLLTESNTDLFVIFQATKDNCTVENKI